MKELVKKLRKYEIRIRKAINTQMQGDFHSVFKGTGLEFDDVRAYQYGDDVRAIDWNVSAKGHGTFIKTYREEKEQSVFLILDVSASQEIGPAGNQKLDVGKEICGVLALSAARQASQIGIVCFSDQKEKYIPAGKGINHAYTIIKSIFELQPKSQKTNLAAGIKLALSIIKRRSIILLISDFIDQHYEKELTMLAKKHDLIVIQLQEKREVSFPALGIVPLHDMETGRTTWVNTSSAAFQKKYLANYALNQQKLAKICRRYKANYLSVQTSEDYVPQLVNLFLSRNRTRKSA
ncbi:MAG: DUF58 domain-containing protein [Hymenobacteraceae bacterium]|nr:DUF58 domain-containing protein [Hymenobacteraceae bacterium]MDX5394924.1 DUF58 domain-containing protein [Hymenobacteraceae bacterium]MDX5444039.1 DUF58 domain-containing protein [Hymenobacteraceae bacterium]MDX5510959.1 DUF58 domain-containing protein [Hymenobacteraceae bacterium]